MPGAAVRVRRIRPDEGAALRSVRLRALAGCPAAFSTTFAEAMRQPEAWWEGRAVRGAESADLAYFLAEDGGRPFGMVGAHRPDGGPAVHLISLWVDRAERRRGCGKALVEAVLAWARSGGAVQVELDVRRANLPARRLYAAIGFAEAASPAETGSGPEAEIRLSLPLA